MQNLCDCMNMMDLCRVTMVLAAEKSIGTLRFAPLYKSADHSSVVEVEELSTSYIDVRS